MGLNLLVHFFCLCFIIRSKTSSVGCGLYDTRTFQCAALLKYLCLMYYIYIYNLYAYKNNTILVQTFNGDDLRRLQSNIVN